MWDWITRNTGEYLSGQEGWVPGRGTAKKVKQEFRGGDANWIPEVSVVGGDRSPRASVLGIGADPSYNPSRNTSSPDDPTDTKITETTETTPQVDPAFAAFQALQAENAAKARGLREDILGRRDDVESILATIIANIDAQLKEAKGQREAQFNRDVESLVGSLDGAIPEIQNAFAALGLSNSTYKADRVGDTRTAYENSYDDTNRQLGEDLAGYQQNATGEKTKARTGAEKMFNTFDRIGKLDANADNLSRFQESDAQTANALSDFRGQSKMYQPGGKALEAISALDGDYDFGKTLESFNTFASNKANPAGGATGGAAKGGKLFKDDEKKGKKKTEVEINNPVGAASA